VRSGLNSTPPRRPAYRRPEEAVLLRIDALKTWRKETARKYSVESDVILPKDLLESIAHRNPEDLTGLDTVMSDFPWRYNHFNGQILSVLKELERS
jgi:ribonuclease D